MTSAQAAPPASYTSSMVLTQCTSIITWPSSTRLSLLTEKSSSGAAASSVSPASSRIRRNLPASTRRRTIDPSWCT